MADYGGTALNNMFDSIMYTAAAEVHHIMRTCAEVSVFNKFFSDCQYMP